MHLAVLYSPSTGADTGVEVPYLDKAVHVAVFAAVAWAGAAARVPLRLLVPLLVLHAPVSELVQGAVLPERAADPADAVADLAGVAVGLAAGRAVGARARTAGRSGRAA